jgi:hypothetical protein
MKVEIRALDNEWPTSEHVATFAGAIGLLGVTRLNQTQIHALGGLPGQLIQHDHNLTPISLQSLNHLFAIQQIFPLGA